MRALILILGMSFCYSGLAAEKLNLSTFNLKWFGLGGGLRNQPDQEFRQEYIKRFVDQELAKSDVIVFTEVTNPDLLSQIMSHRFDCVTYERESLYHQRVVTCFDPQKYRVEKYDADYIIPEVALGRNGLRPATQMKICKKAGSCFLQVIGVHLIAGKKTGERIQQIGFLSDDLKKQSRALPTVITGDFNSYIIAQSGLEKDDITLFEESLSTRSRKFKSVTRGIPTYQTGERGRSYDHIVLTSNIKSRKVKGYRACAKDLKPNENVIPYHSFRKYFSDHCPVTAELTIPTK